MKWLITLCCCCLLSLSKASPALINTGKFGKIFILAVSGFSSLVKDIKSGDTDKSLRTWHILNH